MLFWNHRSTVFRTHHQGRRSKNGTKQNCYYRRLAQTNSVTILQGFLRLTGYYRKFIKDYEKIVSPLIDMLKKNNFQWSSKAESVFLEIKKVMTYGLVLVLPDFTKTFIIKCDASNSGVGVVLTQEKKPIAFFSQALKGRNATLSTYDKEMLALVLAVQKWRPYLPRKTFVVHTDHKSLKYLWSQRITTLAQQRWLSKLMGYDFSIEYKQGKKNSTVDALSRREEPIQMMAISVLVPIWLETIQEENKAMQRCKDCISYSKKGNCSDHGHVRMKYFFTKNGFTCYPLLH